MGWERPEATIVMASRQMGEVVLTDTLGCLDVETMADAVSADAVTGYHYSLYGGLTTAFQPVSITHVTTGVKHIHADATDGHAAYRPSGGRAGEAQRGLYIDNGKKAIRK